ncbi:MAG: hypothetical protein IPJ07_18110 [Acidobacteria bacterium]|nr:hypothetical protein [Acidobacteriota bacterium]
MPIRLIYHQTSVDSDNTSPFDKAIVKITEDEDIMIAGPYLEIHYLEQIINSGNSWRLLTDIEKWLLAYDNAARQIICNFIVANTANIHHCKKLHARSLSVGITRW